MLDGRRRGRPRAFTTWRGRSRCVCVYRVGGGEQPRAMWGRVSGCVWKAAIRKLNYRPNLIARSLARQERRHTIGMIVPDIGNPFFPVGGSRGRRCGSEARYNLLLCNSDDSLTRRESYRAAFVEAVDRNFVDEGGGRFPAARCGR